MEMFWDPDMTWRWSVALPLVATVWVAAPAQAQLSRVEGAVQEVYRLMPELPLEDGYPATGDSRGFRTLMHRLMVYHIQVMGRTPFSRLDWQLTLADYLDANEVMLVQNYPGATIFATNPYHGDRTVIQSLTRPQRHNLLRALLISFGANPEPDQRFVRETFPGLGSQSALPTPTPQPWLIPATGGADLLR